MIAVLLAALLAQEAALPPCVDAASELLRTGRHLDAAAAAERCWLTTRHSNALLIAIQGWVHSHHYAQAAFDLDRYSERVTEMPWSISTLTELRSRIARSTGELVLEISPPLRDGELVQFELEYLGGSRPRLRGRSAALSFRLDAGRWRITIKRDGHATWTDELALSTRTRIDLVASTDTLAAPSTLTVAVAPTTIHLGPERARKRGVTLHLRRADDPRAPSLEIPVTTPALVLHLAPGRWHLQTRAPGFESSTTTFVADGRTLHVQLHRGGTP